MVSLRICCPAGKDRTCQGLLWALLWSYVFALELEMAAVDGKWAPTPASFLRPALPKGHVQPGFVDLAAWMPGEGIRGGESGTSWFPLPPRGGCSEDWPCLPSAAAGTPGRMLNVAEDWWWSRQMKNHRSLWTGAKHDDAEEQLDSAACQAPLSAVRAFSTVVPPLFILTVLFKSLQALRLKNISLPTDPCGFPRDKISS